MWDRMVRRGQLSFDLEVEMVEEAVHQGVKMWSDPKIRGSQHQELAVSEAIKETRPYQKYEPTTGKIKLA